MASAHRRHWARLEGRGKGKPLVAFQLFLHLYKQFPTFNSLCLKWQNSLFSWMDGPWRESLCRLDFWLPVNHPLCLGYVGQCRDSWPIWSSMKPVRFPEMPVLGPSSSSRTVALGRPGRGEPQSFPRPAPRLPLFPSSSSRLAFTALGTSNSKLKGGNCNKNRGHRVVGTLLGAHHKAFQLLQIGQQRSSFWFSWKKLYWDHSWRCFFFFFSFPNKWCLTGFAT